MSYDRLPSDTGLAYRVIEAEKENVNKRMDRGVIGILFGSVANKPGNIAGFSLIVFSSMFGLVLALGADSPSLSKKDALTIVGSFITLTLGFVFGRTTSDT